MNMNLAYKVEKCRHIGDKYYYLYECLPKKAWAVVVYENDDDTMLYAEYFTDWNQALTKYNEIKKTGGEQ